MRVINFNAINTEKSDVILNIEKHCINGYKKLMYKVDTNFKITNTLIKSTNCRLSIKFCVNKFGFIYHEKNNESKSNISRLKRVIKFIVYFILDNDEINLLLHE